MYDLEERTLVFAKESRQFIRKIKKDICNIEDCKQFAKSSASIGANYIEANESLSKKDFRMRVKISKKEAKESIFWLKLIETFDDNEAEKSRQKLIQESTEIMKILGAILAKSV